MLKENLNQVKERIEAACKKAGRDPEEVTLVAVSKKKPLENIETLLAEGQLEFGENYVQELCEKDDRVSRPVHWHMIGHLQTNKVKYVVDKAALIESVDSVHLAKQIDKEAAKTGRIVPILIQVNIAKEDTKFGIAAEELEDMLGELCSLSHIQVRGLMTSAPRVDDPEKNRCYFKKLHELFVDIREKNIDNITMDILSMGMTNDFEVAIEEGATMVRVGTAIFGERK